MNTLHEEIIENLNWQHLTMSVEEATDAVIEIENSIFSSFDTKTATKVIGLTNEAFRALNSEGFEVDEGNYESTIVFIDLPGCFVYVFDRHCFWDKETETRQQAWERMKAAGHESMCLIDDDSSSFVPFFTYGSQHKIIEIEGWIDPPRPVIEYHMNPNDLEEPPF